MQQIDTGYKPEFALGALYHGMNAANAEDSNELELIRQFLANHQKQQEMPNEILKSNLEGARAAEMNNPDSLDWHRRGYDGQMKSQDAAGQFAQATLNNKILQGNQELKEKFAKGQISEQEYLYQLERIKRAMAGEGPAQQGTGQIGFDMQPPAVDPSTANYGNEGRSIPILKTEAAMRGSMGNDYHTGSKPYDLQTIDAEIARNPAARGMLMQERARIEKELAAGGGGTGTPNMGAMPGSASLMNRFSQSGAGSANPWLQGVDMQDPRHQNIMGAFMDTPEFRQKMAGAEHRTDAQMEQAQLRAQAIKDAQAAKQKIDNPKYKEQLAAAIQTMANPQATAAEKSKADVFIQYHKMLVVAANPANYQDIVDLPSYGVNTRKPAVDQTAVGGGQGTQTGGKPKSLSEY